MNPRVSNSIKYLIIGILENNVFDTLNKSRKDFIANVLWHILSIKGRINFLQLGDGNRFRKGNGCGKQSKASKWKEYFANQAHKKITSEFKTYKWSCNIAN